jgi:Transposase DDE domain
VVPAESVEPEQVVRDRSARIAQAQAAIDAEIAAERAKRQDVVQQYLARIAAGEKVIGPVPAEVKVALAERQLAQAIAAAQATHARRFAVEAVPVGQRRAGPIEHNARVRRAQARLDKARVAEAVRAEAPAAAAGRTANITDPQSRLQPVRGGGWLQGYNCQAVTAADGLILATSVRTSPVDNQYRRDMVDKAVAAAELTTRHRRADSSGQPAAESIGIVLADAGYCTRENLTAPGPNLLIAIAKSRDLHTAASDNPAEGPPPDDSDLIAAMQHRLRTPDGMARYAQRSLNAETPVEHAKHNLGFRRFTSCGLARARSEWAFHAAVHNIGHLIGGPLLA